MKKLLAYLLLVLAGYQLSAQNNAPVDTSWKKQYRETSTKVNDLVHTKMDAKFDYDKMYLLGKAWITLKPHFYPTDSLQLDAKGMDIHKVAIVKGGKETALKYDYDGWQLNI